MSAPDVLQWFTRPGARTAPDTQLRRDQWLTGLIAAVGILFPVVVMFPNSFGTNDCVRGSLSAYYYSNTRDLFVGALCALGFFLISFSGAFTGRVESVMSTIAGGAAIVVAILPTDTRDACMRGFSQSDSELSWLQTLFTPHVTEWLHFIFAGVFIGCLLVLSVCFALWTHRGQRMRAVHFVWSILILLAVIYILAFNFFNLDWFPTRPFGVTHSMLIGEIVAIEAFSLSWLSRFWELRNAGPVTAFAGGT